MIRSLLIATATHLLAGQSLRAQVPFNYELVNADPGLVYCLSIVPLGSGVYRLSGTTSGKMIGMDLHADGTVDNAYKVALDTNDTAYPHMVLHTSDGGHLLAYYWVADGTDKWVFLKTDAAGVVEWNRYYPDNYGMLIDPLGGMVEKDGHYFALAHLQAVPANEGWACVLLELDNTGTLVAHRQFAGGDQWSEASLPLIHDHSNGLITVSVLRPYFSQATFPQISVQRWNADLGLAWSRQYSLGNYHSLTSVNELADGGLVFTGNVRLSNFGNFLPFIFKVDTMGEVVWCRRNEGNLPVLQDLVEESDGSFVAVGYNSTSERVIARLDSAGALIEAWRSTASVGLPTELVRDGLTNEHLVRFAAPPMVMRLDSTWRIDCDQEAYSWSDTLIAPVAVNYPVVLNMAAMLQNFDSLVTSQPLVLTTIDPCLSTALATNERASGVEAWPVPTSGPVNIHVPGAGGGMMECLVLDAEGRSVHGTRIKANMDVVQVDLGMLADGPYVIVLRSGPTAERVLVLKQ
jgi:hypothetical protein